PRDLAALNAYEQRAYLRRIVPVLDGAARRPALVYLAPERGGGKARPGYQELVVASAREWELPETYVATLERFIPGFCGTLGVATGEMGGGSGWLGRLGCGDGCKGWATAPSSRIRRRCTASTVGCVTAAMARSRQCLPAIRKPCVPSSTPAAMGRPAPGS